MKELKRLKSIMNALSEAELTSLKGFLNYRFERSGKYRSTFLLFNILVESKDFDHSQVSLELYGEENFDALRKLVQRLTDGLLEFMISKEMLEENDYYDERSRSIFSIKRKMLVYDFLSSHGLTYYALSHLNQIISIAKEYEYYDYLIIALDKKLSKVSVREGNKEYKKVYDEILFYSQCNIYYKQSVYNLRLYSSYSFNYNSKIHYGELVKVISELKSAFRWSKSRSIRENIYYLENILLNEEGDTKKCYANFIGLNNYLNSNKKIVPKSQKLQCELNLADCEMKLGDFSKSIKRLDHVMLQHAPNGLNRMILKEIIFYNNFYSNNIDDAYKAIDEMLLLSEMSASTERYNAKYNYYISGLKFIDQNFLESKKYLNKCKLLDKDKSGWNIGIRLLLILNNIELGKLLIVENEVENLRKHMSRIEIDSNLTQRLNLIGKLLINVVNSNFDYQKAIDNNQDVFRKLSSNNSEYSWQVKSPELIPFHHWLLSKSKGIPYNHAEAMKQWQKKVKAAKRK